MLVGGADETGETGEVFAYENLNRAFAELREGARLVCLHKNRWWQTSRGALLDAGAFVAGLEYAAETEAEVVGKPTAAYFQSALAELQASPGEAVMVGDDIEADIGGAKGLGMRGVLVRTGKFRPASLASADPQPDARHRLDRGPARAARGGMKVGLDVIEIRARRPDARALLRLPRARASRRRSSAYCDSRPNPAQHYAARFAGKEAVGKALGFGVARAFAWKDVEIAGRPKPDVRLRGRLGEWAERVGAGPDRPLDDSLGGARRGRVRRRR